MSYRLRLILSFLVVGNILTTGYAATQSIVGSWRLGDTSEEGSGLLVFLPNGYYIHMEDTDDPSGTDGMERGTYVWDESTGAFGVIAITDTNGDIGLSSAGVDLSFGIAGGLLNGNDGGESFSLPRIAEPTDSILGTWLLDTDSVSEIVVISFFDNGYYYLCEEVNPDNTDPNEMTGIERGTYTWDAGTGDFTATAIVDTNGDIGVDGAEFVATVSGSIMTVDEGGGEFSELRRISNEPEVAVNRSIVGSWNVGRGSVITILENGYYFLATLNTDISDPSMGMRRGTYTYDAQTFEDSFTPITDTIVSADVCPNPDSIFKTAAHDDMLYFNRGDCLFEWTRIKGEENQLAGSWLFGDSTTDGSGVITFFNGVNNPAFDGVYFHCEDIDAEDEAVATDSSEWGLYRWNALSGKFSATAIYDKNGEAGLSHSSGFRLWALADKLVVVDSEVEVLQKVSESTAPVTGLIYERLDDDTMLILHSGIFQGSPNLDTWTDEEIQPTSPWFPTPDELTGFYRSRE